MIGDQHLPQGRVAWAIVECRDRHVLHVWLDGDLALAGVQRHDQQVTNGRLPRLRKLGEPITNVRSSVGRATI